MLIGVIALGYYYQDYLFSFMNKVKGVYLVFKGDKKLNENNLDEAIIYYKKALELYPKHSKAECNLANIYVMVESYNKAIEHYRKALNNNPNMLLCRINLGLVLSEQKIDYEGAILEYEKAIKIKLPKYHIPYFYANKETALHNKGIAFYNMGLAYRGKSLLAGDNYIEASEYLSQAANQYSKAIKILKDDYNVYYNYALANHLLNKPFEAQKGYCKAISIEPLKYEAHYNLAILLMQLNMYEQAYLEMEKATLILDLNGNTNISRYIFDLMNEISQKIIYSGKQKFFTERFEENFKTAYGISYSPTGSIIINEEFDKIMYNNLKTCAVEELLQEKD